MEYGNIIHGTFVSRPNRFIANVTVNGSDIQCHVKNTGRCRELLIPGADVILCEAEGQNRKTEYDLVSVYKNGVLINMDSQAPNKIAAEYIPSLMPDLLELKPEVRYGDSRFDFYAKTQSCEAFIEVKGVTLEKDGVALFPDAPTARGVKHLNGLISAALAGYRAAVIFIIQMNSVKYFTPNMETNPEFGKALIKAHGAGVEMYAVSCRVSEKVITPGDLVKIVLPE
jgi:sugar fermentation stimulation protein A